MNFYNTIKKYIKKTEYELRYIVSESYLITFSRVVARTPVDTGLARGNWRVTISRASQGRPINRYYPDEPLSPGGMSDNAFRTAYADFSTKITTDNAEKRFFLSNNLPYINALEYDSHSGQAPAGMYRRTMMEFPQIVRYVASTV